jgi:hypothetical protein
MKLFNAGDPLEKLVVASFSGLRAALDPHNISWIWGTSDLVDTPERQAVRPPAGSSNGVVTMGNRNMPQAGLWMSGATNTVYLFRPEMDMTVVDWHRRAGTIREESAAITPVTTLEQMEVHLARSGRLVYAVDDYRPACMRLRNPASAFAAVNSKWEMHHFSGQIPFEKRFANMHASSLEVETLFEKVKGDGDSVVLKACNTEHGGTGVKKATTFAEYVEKLGAFRAAQLNTPALTTRLVLQRGHYGAVARSFSIFLGENSEEVEVIALTDQINDPATGRDLGNRLYPLTVETLRPLGPMILDLANRIRRRHPKAFGVVMCDFLDFADGRKLVIDPGLRPSASTPPALASLWIAEQTGNWLPVRNGVRPDTKEPGVDFAEACKRLEHLADPDRILADGYGAMPYAWEPSRGCGRLLTVAADDKGHAALEQEIAERLAPRQ